MLSGASGPMDMFTLEIRPGNRQLLHRVQLGPAKHEICMDEPEPRWDSPPVRFPLRSTSLNRHGFPSLPEAGTATPDAGTVRHRQTRRSNIRLRIYFFRLTDTELSPRKK